MIIQVELYMHQHTELNDPLPSSLLCQSLSCALLFSSETIAGVHPQHTLSLRPVQRCGNNCTVHTAIFRGVPGFIQVLRIT